MGQERGVGGPIIPPVSTPGNREKPVNGLVFTNLTRENQTREKEASGELGTTDWSP